MILQLWKSTAVVPIAPFTPAYLCVADSSLALNLKSVSSGWGKLALKNKSNKQTQPNKKEEYSGLVPQTSHWCWGGGRNLWPGTEGGQHRAAWVCLGLNGSVSVP